MQKFRKYEMTASQWSSLRKKIEKTSIFENQSNTYFDTEIVAVVVELGNICQEFGVNAEGVSICIKQSTKVSIDIVWQSEQLSIFDKHLIWCEPMGVHSMGATLDKEYADAYCVLNPDSKYCKSLIIDLPKL